MEHLVIIVAINGLAIFVFFMIFGLPAKTYKKRVQAAAERLADTSVGENIHQRYIERERGVYKKATGVYWLFTVGVLVILYIIFNTYAQVSAEGADLMAWLIINMIMYGIALIGCSIVMSLVVPRYVQLKSLNSFLDELVDTHPQSTIIVEAKETIRLRGGEAGVSALSLAAIIGSVLVGASYLIVFYLAAQAAIECARSSKCL